MLKFSPGFYSTSDISRFVQQDKLVLVLSTLNSMLQIWPPGLSLVASFAASCLGAFVSSDCSDYKGWCVTNDHVLEDLSKSPCLCTLRALGSFSVHRLESPGLISGTPMLSGCYLRSIFVSDQLNLNLPEMWFLHTTGSSGLVQEQPPKQVLHELVIYKCSAKTMEPWFLARNRMCNLKGT